MKRTDYPNIAESLYEETLPNGLRVRIVPKKDFALKLAFLAVDFGSIDTDFTQDGVRKQVPEGIAHYLEHKMFDLPDMDANARFAELGASVNAFTSYTMTAYHFSCTDSFRENLELLLRMVTVPYFTEESVEKERGIIEQEILMYEDSPDSRVYEDLFSILFPHHPARVPISGSVESISHIDADMLYACHRAFYTPSNMILCVVGDVEPQEVLDIAQGSTPSEALPAPLRHYGSSEGPGQAVRSQRTMEVSMPTLCMAFRCDAVEKGPASMRRELIGELASEILAGESSPLFSRLYSQGLIDPSFCAGYESIKDLCLLSIYGDSDDPQAVYEAVLEEAQRISREGFSEEWFRRLLHSSLGRRMRDLDSFSSICYRICAYELDDLSYFTFPEAYTDIQPEEVRQFLAQSVCRERSGLSLVHPKED